MVVKLDVAKVKAVDMEALLLLAVVAMEVEVVFSNHHQASPQESVHLEAVAVDKQGVVKIQEMLFNLHQVSHQELIRLVVKVEAMAQTQVAVAMVVAEEEEEEEVELVPDCLDLPPFQMHFSHHQASHRV